MHATAAAPAAPFAATVPTLATNKRRQFGTSQRSAQNCTVRVLPSPGDARIYRAWRDGDMSTAATLLLGRYGADILRFIRSRVRDEDRAADVLSDFHVDLWRGFPAFQWRCPVKAWAFTLARNAANRYLKAPWRRPSRNIALDDICEPSVDPRADEQAPIYLDDGVKAKLREIREALRPADQQLLALRVEKQMAWRDLTIAIHGPIADADELRRLTARMRKRFQLVKERIRRATSLSCNMG